MSETATRKPSREPDLISPVDLASLPDTEIERDQEGNKNITPNRRPADPVLPEELQDDLESLSQYEILAAKPETD